MAPARLWIDLEDLFEFATFATRPSGIQRVVMEISAALGQMQEAADRYGFVRHDAVRGTFAVVGAEDVSRLFATLSSGGSPHRRRRVAVPRVCGRLRTLSRRVPGTIRRPLIRALRLQRDAMLAAGEAAREIVRYFPGAGAAKAHGEGSADGFARSVRAGDVILALGAPWSHPGYGALIERTRRRFGTRFLLLIHDILPIVRPEYFPPGVARTLEPWLEAVLPRADFLIAFSNATAADAGAFIARRRIAARVPVVRVPFGGSGLTRVAPVASARLPRPGTYVLCVSTIEPRKNHALLFRVWRRLLEERAQDTVPAMVFAGRTGWLVEDLTRQLDSTDHLGGKITVIPDATDHELAALYRGCLFTMFPSFREGWGVPVVESLAFGKPCLASNAAAIQEAGGSLVRYFDPDNVAEAHALTSALLDDPRRLADWAAEIERAFNPPSWQAWVRAILAAVDIA